MVRKKDLIKTFYVAEPLLRRASKVLSDKIDQIERFPTIQLTDTCPFAFGALLMFVYHGTPFPDGYEPSYYENLRLLDLSVDLCALAEKLEMSEFYNHSLRCFESVSLENWADTDDYQRCVEQAYRTSPRDSTLRKYTMMFLERETYGRGLNPEDSEVVKDVKELLQAEEQGYEKGTEFFVQLVKIVLHNSGRKSNRKEEPVPIEEYLMK